MRYEAIRSLPDQDFRRLTGIKPKTFEQMAKILRDEKTQQKARGGKPNSLGIEDQLLMTLGYWREYRTYFHIAQSYGKSESQAYRIIRWCEETLAKSKAFRLPGRKFAMDRELQNDVILIDATETPIQRPKKSNVATTRERRNGIP